MVTTHYKTPLSRAEWKKYAQLRRQYLNKEISHSQYVFYRNIVLEEGTLTNLMYTFEPYFLSIIGKEEGNESCTDEKIAAILASAKKVKEERSHKDFLSAGLDYFRGHPVNWEYFRGNDECYNSYDCHTQKAIIPWRFSDEDKKDFREKFEIEFHDPYCDGRDCTGAPFTGWMQFLRCKDRTIILHCVEYDV